MAPEDAAAPEPSWELRWFVDGDPPPQLFANWDSSPEASGAEERVDTYLRLDQGAGLVGLKLREGYLELKGRHVEVGPIEVLPNVHGRLEHWTKWRVSMRPGGEPFAESAWVPVRKRRLLRMWALDGAGRPSLADGGEQLVSGVLAELTQVQVGSRRAWTFGVEAFPGAEVAAQGALAVARRMLRGNSIALGLERALSYPGWLARL